MKITKITVMVNTGQTDRLSLETDLPSPFTYNPDGAPLYLDSEASPGKGVEFACTHFPDVPIRVIDVATGVRTKITSASE